MTGIETFAIAGVSGIAVPIFQSLWGSGGKVFGLISKQLDEKTRHLIHSASGQYSKRYLKRHGILKALGMREAVGLDSVYTDVQFLDEQEIRSFESIQNLEEAYREANQRSFQPQNCQKAEGLKIANDKQYLMVLGQPGAGKSTFLRKMGLEALNGKKGGFNHGCIPVFIELKSFTSSQIEIEKFIVDEFTICGFPSPDQFMAKALEQGKLLILLDGLDEVPTVKTNEVISQIQNFVDRYDKNRFIVSCRIAAYQNNFKRFTDVKLADFDDIQIEQFIKNWFQSEVDKQAGTAQKCWELLQQPAYSAAKELAHTPLLLTFLCLNYDRSQNFPNNRSALYKKALGILLEEWAAEKRIDQDKIYQGLNTGLEETLLSEIAYTGFEANKLFFSQREVVEQIKSFLANDLNAPKHLDGEAVLNAIEVQQGILVERAEDVYSFSHLTLQEYLTAQYIVDNNLIEPLVNCHLSDERWREVFLLVAGLVRSKNGADDLLLLMEKEAQKYINTPKLQGLLQWADEATKDSEGDFKPVGKRAIAIANAYDIAIAYTNANAIANNANANANVYAYANVYAIAIANVYAYAIAIAIANANDIANVYAYAYDNAYAYAIAIAYAYAEELKELKIFKDVNWTELIAQLETLRKQVPDDNEPKQVHLAFANRVLDNWCNALHLAPEIVKLSQEKANALGDYLYANNLIIQCKETAVRISAKTWDEIESRMLLVPEKA
ncbi:NACHT domain-containing protein [Planktothrix agardhii 1032]|uniref:NACHT domain-containing protein n=1 Tax=Planktothrix agardhii TaxID=1160 RepID=UPI001D0B75EB|nr:NACHT domain-containing protein [Planktothrix agardhii]MCB8780221.1 NACHT domain-containing protein [Planktothrix agardhii 1031]MCF3600798.1 NACHT domain-containing protein [Planktothrix agardhii 1032]